MSGRLIRAAVLCGGALVVAVPAAAQPRQTTYVDLSGDLGYSTNPFLSMDDSSGSAFARVSAYGVHAWTTERSETALSAYLENSAYLRRYGNKQLFDLNARTSFRTSETVQLFGNVGFSGDFGGQLGTRFVNVPATTITVPGAAAPSGSTSGAVPGGGATPQTPITTLPPPVTVVDPELLSLTGRQFRLSGQGGAVFRPNNRDIWTVSGGIQRLFYTGDDADFDYTVYSLLGSYDRQLSERTTVGFRTTLQRSDYQSGGSTTLVSPQLTARTRLAEAWDASVAVGVTYASQDFAGRDESSIGLSFDGQLCRAFEQSRFCGRLSRYQQNSINADLLTTTSAGVDYSYRIDQNQSLQLSASAIRYSGGEMLDEDITSHYLVTSGSYNRRLNDRLSGGVNASLRKLAQFGPDPKLDAGASVFVRYRLGDLQ